MRHLRFCVSVCLSMLASVAGAYTLRQIDNTDGLTNSAVLSVEQDESGRLWIGTCDGLNLFDGRNVTSFGLTESGQWLTGELISALEPAGENGMWIATNYGLNRFSAKADSLRHYPRFHELRNMSVNSRGHLFVVSQGNAVYYNTCDSSGRGDEFMHLHGLELGDVKVLGIKATDSCLWLFTDKGVIGCGLIYRDGAYRVGKQEHSAKDHIAGCFLHGDDALYIDGNNDLFRFSFSALEASRLLPLGRLVTDRGRISDILALSEDGPIFVAFATGGVVRLSAGQFTGAFDVEDIGVKGGAYCLMSDKNQDIVWIGSDGNGLYEYFEDTYSFRQITFSDLNNRISRPVRSVCLDDNGTLWIGTKGDGLLKVEDFKPWDRAAELSTEIVTSTNSRLLDNSVYAIARSHDGGLWIGSDGGINYASGRDGTLFNVATEMPLPYVHAIYQPDDTTLWIATVGNGIYRAIVEGTTPSGLRLVGMEHLVVGNGSMDSNYFFALHHDDSGRIFAGNRGFGLFEVTDDKLNAIPLKGKYATKTVNDIFAIEGNADTLWLGTGNGLIMRALGGGEKIWNGNSGFPNSAVHMMLDDGYGNLWVATNLGLARVDMKTGSFQTYGRSKGFDVTEFSDGAAAKHGDTMFFGGVNGLVVIRKNERHKDGRVSQSFSPSIYLWNLKIAGHDVAMNDYLNHDGRGGEQLRLSSEMNTFTVEFFIPDYIDADGYIYMYRLDGGEWMQAPVAGSVSFTAIPHGDYALDVKAVNRTTGVESQIKTLRIHISAPWYLSGWAKLVYFVAFVAFLLLLWVVGRHKARLKHEELVRKIEYEQKEKTYEEKLRFFTNITHEFCTPLTLIYGPCERILSKSEKADPSIHHYASLIKSNAERLNSLIQEIIDFRRVETGNHKTVVSCIDVAGLCSDILASFDVIKEQRKVNLEIKIEPELVWPTDYKCFTKIVYNLVSNAFKYTPENGLIRVSVSASGDNLCLKVYNTGKGIKPEDRKLIFNRYTILDSVEGSATRGISSRNGLGMAICHSMIELLGGSIAIESEVGKYAEFIVTLPRMKVDETSGDEAVSDVSFVGSGSISLPQVSSLPDSGASESSMPKTEGVRGQKRILVIDDNKDILGFLAESLVEYDVETASSAEEAMAMVREQSPDLIITDLMMPGTDGMEFTKMLRRDRHMAHVPLVILSARSDTNDKVEGLQSGADAYVTKPFTLSYLRAVVERLLKGKYDMQEYLNTSASAYQYAHGRLMDKESIRFVDRLNEYIEENLDNPDLSPESLASHFQTSTRNLYRKMKDLGLQPANDFIKEHRITFAAKLLVTTTLTVQEIIYRCGFNNRSHFYKEFDKRHGMTPKEYRVKHGGGEMPAGEADGKA